MLIICLSTLLMPAFADEVSDIGSEVDEFLTDRKFDSTWACRDGLGVRG